MSFHNICRLGLCVLAVTFASACAAWEINDQLTINTAATGVWQYGDYTQAFDMNGEPLGSQNEGSLAVDLSIDYQPTASSNLFALVSIAKGNGLNGLGGVSVAVNADDLEDDVKNINGSGRDYLLEAWYRHSFQVKQQLVIQATAGIISATSYIDHNELANDETTQFMNEVFVNKSFLPTYDPGVALKFEFDNWHAHLVWMDAEVEAEEGSVGHSFFGADIGFSAQTHLGAGNYHLILQTTDRRFTGGATEATLEEVSGIGISVDQQISPRFGAFARLGGTNRNPSVLVHSSLYSAGIVYRDRKWRDPQWEIGVAYAYLDGVGNRPSDISKTQVLETYAKYLINRYLDISLDLQHVLDNVIDGTNPELWVVGLRMNGYF